MFWPFISPFLGQSPWVSTGVMGHLRGTDQQIGRGAARGGFSQRGGNGWGVRKGKHFSALIRDLHDIFFCLVNQKRWVCYLCNTYELT